MYTTGVRRRWNFCHSAALVALNTLMFAHVLFAQTDSATANANLDSLIISALGGPDAIASLDTVQSITTIGHVRLNDLEGEYTTVLVFPNKYYSEQRFPGFSLAQGYDGTTAWLRSHNGQYEAIAGIERSELLQSLYFESFGYLTNGHVNNTIDYHGRVILDNVDFHEVSFQPPDLPDTILGYFTSLTGDLRMALSKYDNAMVLTYVDQFTTVGGIRFASLYRMSSPSAGLSVEMRVDTIMLNASVDSALFSHPEANEPDFRFPENKDSVVVAISYENGNIFVTAHVNGKRNVKFILDTGSSTNIYSTLLLADADLPVVGELPVKGVGGFSSLKLVQVDSLTLGKVTLLKQIGGCMDLGAALQFKESSKQYVGILGYDFLSRFPFRIDYEKEQLILYNPAKFKAPTNGTKIPFELSMFIPMVHGELNGIAGDFIVDLGNAFGVVAHSHFAEVNHLRELLRDVRPVDRQLGGIGGLLDAETGVADSLKIGALRATGVELLLPGESTGVSGSEAIAGNIGNRFLEQYRVIFDYATNEMIFLTAPAR